MIDFIIIIILIIALVLVLHFTGVFELRLDFSNLNFLVKKLNKQQIKIEPLFSFQPVISQDGKIYKAHVIIGVTSVEEVIFSNWTLKVRGLYSGVYHQHFDVDDQGNRSPSGQQDKSIAIKGTETIGIEFEPRKSWAPVAFSKRKYKCVITAKTISKKIKTKFSFEVRDRDLKNIQEETRKNKKRAFFVKFPIVT